MAKIIAVDISEQAGIHPGEAIMVVEMGEFPKQRAMKEIWHGTREDAMALRDALDALLPASAPAKPGPKKKTPKAKKPKTPAVMEAQQRGLRQQRQTGQRGSEAGCYS